MLTLNQIRARMDYAFKTGWTKIQPSGDRIIGINPDTGLLDEIPEYESDMDCIDCKG